MKDIKLVSMEQLFHTAGYDYKKLKENSEINISDKNIKIKSYNHKLKKVEFKKILTLVRKKDSILYEIKSLDDQITYLKATGDHRIFIQDLDQYVALKDLHYCKIFLDTGDLITTNVIKTNKLSPILDIHVEDNKNYFSNSLLSHNTGGNSYKYYSSIRLEVFKKETLSTKETPYGMMCRIKTVKNKVACPYRDTMVKLLFGKGYDVEGEWVEFAVKENLIQKGGAWYTLPNGEQFQGLEKTIAYFKSNKEYYEKEIIEKVRNKMFNLKKEEVEKDDVQN